MGTEVVNYTERLAAMARQEARKETPVASSISLRAGMLSYNGQPVPGNKLDTIIVASTHANLYYDRPYDPDNVVNPTCWAYSEDGEDMKPAPEVAKPQAESCAVCPLNAWGSDPRGGRGKACQNRRVLALIPASSKPEEIPTAEIATLKLPVMSTKNYQMYVQKCAALYNRPPLGLVTQIGTMPDQKSQFKVTFTDVRPLSDEAIMPVLDRLDGALALMQPTYDPNPEITEEPPKKAGKKF